MNFDNFKYRKDQVPGRLEQSYVFYENLKNTFYEELKNTDIHNDFFKGYNPDSVEDFKLQYAKQKANLAEYYSIFINETYQNKELKYREHTEKIFEMILQKKLWNMQLQWRAGQINIKEIRTSWDFGFWESHINSCPFLPMVTETEIEVMKQFLNDNNYEDPTQEWMFDWQDYDEIMEKDENGDRSSMPDWYEFYDNRMGTSILLQLPNTRGIKEANYLDLGRAYFFEKSKESNPVPPPVYVPPPPYCFATFEQMYNYASKFENDQHFVELFRINYEMNKPKKTYGIFHNELIYEAIELLKESETPVYMPGGYEWREAVVKCSQQYLNRIVAKEIEVVYEEYKMFSEIGLSKNDDDEVMKQFENYEIAKIIGSRILKGRELDGEPQDFNY